jgi:hypothetical protein
MASKKKSKTTIKAATAISAANNGPTPEELAQLRKALDKATAGFWAAYGDVYDYMLVCPPGPIPPPKLEATVLNLAVQ